MSTSIRSLAREIILRRAWFLVSVLVPFLAFLWKIIVTMLSPEAQSRLRYLGFERRTFLELVGVLTALCIIGVTIEGALKAIRRREREQENIRNLALIILRGRQLQDLCADVFTALPEKDVDLWTMDVARLLDRFGGKYAEDFPRALIRPSPITVVETYGGIQEAIHSRPHYDAWKRLSHRIARLDQYLADLSSR
jgi:hypothetical protein